MQALLAVNARGSGTRLLSDSHKSSSFQRDTGDLALLLEWTGAREWGNCHLASLGSRENDSQPLDAFYLVAGPSGSSL